MSDVSNYFGGVQDQARINLVAAQDDEPDQAARAMELEKATGVPATAIYGDLEGFERQNRAALGSGIVSDNEYIADYLNSHPMAARVSHDDVGQLDTASRAISGLGKETKLSEWLNRNQPSYRDEAGVDSKPVQSFTEGFGTAPLGWANLMDPKRPGDLEWALSHPEVAALWTAAAAPVELLTRTASGLIHLGHDGLEQMFGKSFADEMAAMAEWGMTRGDIGVTGGGGGAGGIRATLENKPVMDAIRSVAKGLELSDPWTKVGLEPPAGIHPLIDEAKKLQTKEDLDALDEALKESQKSATRERSPELYANFVRAHVGDREIGISSDAIRQLYGEKVPEAGDNLLGWDPAMKDKLAAAELAGTDVQVSLADWLANVDPEVAKALHDDIRVRDTGLTVNEGKLKSEPKAAGPDIAQQVRGAAGFEPMFAAGDRFVRLSRKLPKEADAEMYAQGGLHDVQIFDENDNPIGMINLSTAQGGKQLYIDMISAGSRENKFYQPNYLGPSMIRDLKRQLKNLFPEAETITGHRVSGAREKAGEAVVMDPTKSMPVVKLLETPSGWGEVEPMRGLLQGIWEQSQGFEVFKGEKTLDQQVLSQAVENAVRQITPKMLGEVKTTPLDLKRTGQPGATAAGVYQRFVNDLPQIIVSLDRGSEAIGLGRHETIHHLRKYGFFEVSEWATLERAARDNGWLEKHGIGTERYKTLEMPAKLEEAIAEEYRAWAGGRNTDPKAHPIFEKLKQFLQTIRDAVSKALGKEPDWEQLFKQIEAGEIGGREGRRPLEERGATPYEPDFVYDAWHGSRHDFDEFKTDHIGTGEGAQSYGHGIYLAQNRDVANTYRLAGATVPRFTFGDRELVRPSDIKPIIREMGYKDDVTGSPNPIYYPTYYAIDKVQRGDTLDAAIKKMREDYEHYEPGVVDGAEKILRDKKVAITSKAYGEGNLYGVRFNAEAHELLDWDKSLDAQDPHVIDAIDRIDNIEKHPSYVKTGGDLVNYLSEFGFDAAGNRVKLPHDSRRATEILQKAGLKGVRYLDQGSRKEGEGTSNFVAFDAKDLSIARRNETEFQPAFAIDEPTGEEPGMGLYDRGKALGVTQTHMDRMLRLIEKRNAEDLQASQRRAELRQRRRSNKDFKERRVTLRDEASADISSRPDIALDKMLTANKFKLDPSFLTEDQHARLPKDYLQKKGGLNPDYVAPTFGYTSGDALVERLGILTEDRRRAGMSHRDYFNRLVDIETDRRLNQEFGDREANILDEAKDQALSETQLDLVHEETLAFALKAGAEPQFTKEQVREMVKGEFDKVPVKQLSSMKLLQTAGAIGKKIEEAGAKGDWETAYRLSQQRNHATIAARFARDYEKSRKNFERTAKTFRKREVPSVGADWTNWIHDILLRVGKPINRSVQDLAENIGRQPEGTLRDFVEAKEAEWMGLRELPVADYLLDPAFRKDVDELPHKDFMGLKESVDTLVKAGRDEKKVYREGEAYEREQVLGDMREQLATFPMKEKNWKPGAIGKWPRALVYGMTNMETVFNRWDRADPRGLFNRMFSYPMADAANGKARLQREVAKAFRELPKVKDIDKLVDAPFSDPMTRTPDNPTGEQWSGFTRGNVLMMLLNAGNKSNWKVLAHGYGAEPEALMQWLHRNTTKADWDWAQAYGKNIFKDLVKKADNVYERMTGATVEKIPLEPIQTPHGDYPGWYFPLIEDPVRKTVWVQDPDTGLWSQKTQGKKETIDNSDFFHFSTSNGYTRRRTGAIYPLDLDFNITPTRIKQMIHDISFREVLHETQKILGDRRFREDVAKHYGKEYADGLIPYLRAVAGAEGIPSAGLAMANRVSEYLRQNTISTYIGFNPYTMLKHGPTAFVMSSREVGPVNFARAVKTLYASAPSIARKASEFALEHSEELQRRERHWQDTIAGQGREIEGAGNLREKIIEKGSAAVAWSDMVSAKPTWLAAYDKYRADNLSHGESVSLADRAVRRAHGSTAETNQPALVRGGGPLHSWLTSVYGFFGTAMQRRIEMAHKVNDAWQLGKEREIKAASKKLGSAFADFMTYMVWPTIVEEFVTGIGTDDHRGLGARIISGATMGAASSVIYLRDLVHGFVSGHEPGVGLASSALHDLNNAMRDVSRRGEALNRQHAGKTVGDLLTVTGEVTGMVPKIIGNAARYGINVMNKQEKPKSVADVLLGVTKGTQKRRQEK